MHAMEKINYGKGIRTWQNGGRKAIILAKVDREGLPEKVSPN